MAPTRRRWWRPIRPPCRPSSTPRPTSARCRTRPPPGSRSGPVTARTRASAPETPATAPRCRSSRNMTKGAPPVRGALPLPFPGSARRNSEPSHEGVRIMTTGKQLAGLLLLSTALTHPGAAIAQDTAEQEVAAPAQSAEADQAQGTEPPADEPAPAEPDVSVPGGDVIFVTGRISRDPTRGSTQGLSVLSTAQIARTGEGNIA